MIAVVADYVEARAFFEANKIQILDTGSHLIPDCAFVEFSSSHFFGRLELLCQLHDLCYPETWRLNQKESTIECYGASCCYPFSGEAALVLLSDSYLSPEVQCLLLDAHNKNYPVGCCAFRAFCESMTDGALVEYQSRRADAWGYRAEFYREHTPGLVDYIRRHSGGRPEWSLYEWEAAAETVVNNLVENFFENK